MGISDSSIPSVLRSNNKCLMNYNKNAAVTEASGELLQMELPDRYTIKKEIIRKRMIQQARRFMKIKA